MTVKHLLLATALLLSATLAFSLPSNRVTAQSASMEPLRPLSDVMERVETEDARLYIAMTCQAIYWMDTGGGLMEPILFFTGFAREVYERRGIAMDVLRRDLDHFTESYASFAASLHDTDLAGETTAQQVRSDRDICRRFLEN